MARQRSKSTLLKLPKDILKQVNDLILAVGEERKTYEQIAEWLSEQGYPYGKSSIGRYAKWILALEKVKVVGEQARSIIEASGEDPLKIEEATSKLGAVVMMEVFQEAMKGDKIDVKHIGKLMGDFARLQTSSVQREKMKADIAEKAKRQALEQAADVVEKTALQQGASKKDAQFWREKVLGIK